MRKFTAAVFLGLALALASTSLVSAQDVKIGFVDTLQVLNGTEEGKKEIQELNEFAAQKQQEIANRTAELQKLQQQYANQQRTLNPETRAEMERAIQDKDRQLKRLQEDVQLEFDGRRNEVFGRMGDKIQTIINEYAPQNGFGVVFLRDQSQTYVDPALDITDAVVELYNQRYPVAGQAAAPAPQ